MAFGLRLIDSTTAGGRSAASNQRAAASGSAVSQLRPIAIRLRSRRDSLNRSLDTKSLELTNLKSELKGRGDERDYLSNLFDEYIRNVETRVHIVELQRYQDQLEEARLAPDMGIRGDISII